MGNETSKRNVNVDLLRCVFLLILIAVHVPPCPLDTNKFGYSVIYTLLGPLLPCYFMLSDYFAISKKLKAWKTTEILYKPFYLNCIPVSCRRCGNLCWQAAFVGWTDYGIRTCKMGF